MKKDLLALLSVPLLLADLAGYATAQDQAQPLPTGTAVEAAEAAEAAPEPAGAAAPAVAPAATIVAPADCGAPCGECCLPTKKICVPTPHKKTKTTTVYSHKCEDICLPYCTCKACQKMHGDCGCSECCESCGDKPCGKVRERRKLVKKFKKEECEEMKCEPVEVPCTPECKPCKLKKCHSDVCCPTACDPCVAAPCDAPVVMPAPIQPMPK